MRRKIPGFANSIAAELPKTSHPVIKMKQLPSLDHACIMISVNKSLEYATKRLEVAQNYKEKDYMAGSYPLCSVILARALLGAIWRRWHC